MNSTKFYWILMIVWMLCIPTNIMAQASADKLFMEGQKLQQIQTVSSQNAAIKKFRAAKIVYTNEEKKKICDNQITICNNNIQAIRTKSVENLEKKEKDAKKTSNETTTKKEKKSTKRQDVRLSLSKSRLDFKYKPKEGATQSVDVNCNYDNWEITSTPDWVTVYLADKKFSVEAKENFSDEERSGVIKVKCGNKEVDLVVNQNKKKGINKVMEGAGKIFKRKKD